MLKVLRDLASSTPWLGTVLAHLPGPCVSLSAAVGSGLVVYLRIRDRKRIERDRLTT